MPINSIDSWVKIPVSYYDKNFCWLLAEDYCVTGYYFLQQWPDLDSEYKDYCRNRMLFRSSLLDPDSIILPDILGYYTPYPEQLTGASYLRMGGGVLADPVGSGKTLSSLLAFPNHKYLIICEKSKVNDWIRELQRVYLIPQDRIGTVKRLHKSSEALVITFNSVRYKREEIRKTISRWDKNKTCIIADEAQKFKNYFTVIRQQMNLLSLDIKKRVALTATPFEISIEELYSIISWARPYHLPPYEFFVKRYVESKNDKEFEWIVKESLLRRVTKRSDSEIETVIIKHRRIGSQVEEYRKLHSKYVMARKLNKLRYHKRLCMLALFDKDSSAKLEILRRIIKKHSGNIVCFSLSEQFIHLIEKELSLYCPLVITGSSSTVQRDRAIDGLGTTSRLLLATNAAERGINLQKANVVVLLDPTSNPARIRQRVGRIYRKGQEAEKVFIYFMVALGTVEEQLLSKIIDRSQKYNTILENEGDELNRVFQEIELSDLKLK